jgi:hypothetical protein
LKQNNFWRLRRDKTNKQPNSRKPTARVKKQPSVKEPLGNEGSRRAPGFNLCLMNILNADQT